MTGATEVIVEPWQPPLPPGCMVLPAACPLPAAQVLLSSEEGVKELQQWPQYANSIVMDPKSEHYQVCPPLSPRCELSAQ